MKLSARKTAAAVAALALFSSVAAGSANASLWSLLSGSSDQSSQSPPLAANAVAKKKVLGKVAVPGAQLQDGSYPGPTVDAYYGQVQVQANISGGKIVSVDVLQYPQDRRTSRYINSQALPILQSEVVSAQTTQVDMVSGATLTSRAFLRSLTGALGQTGN